MSQSTRAPNPIFTTALCVIPTVAFSRPGNADAADRGAAVRATTAETADSSSGRGDGLPVERVHAASAAPITIATDGTLDANFEFVFVDSAGSLDDEIRMSAYMDDLRVIWLSGYQHVQVCGQDAWFLKEGSLSISERSATSKPDRSAVQVMVFDRDLPRSGYESGHATIVPPTGTETVPYGTIWLYTKLDPNPTLTFAHEFGHLLGLIGTYWVEGDVPKTNDAA